MMEKDRLDYLYDQFRITLVILSLPGERQCEITGIGCVGTEILVDFYTYYVDIKSLLLDNGYITKKQCLLLDDFERYLEKFDNRDEEFYWNREVIKVHPDWEELRTNAKHLLNKLFDEKYDVIIKCEYFGSGDKRCERTIRKLILSN